MLKLIVFLSDLLDHCQIPGCGRDSQHFLDKLIGKNFGVSEGREKQR